MPYALLGQSINLSGFLTLPEEILEEIVSELDQHRDLLALALTSKFCANAVIPHHTQYRVLRLRHTSPEIWAHLARRSDLARNIREVYICERHNYRMPDHYPTSLIDNALDRTWRNAEESTRIRNICIALRNMSRLRVFSWSWMANPLHGRPTSHPEHENAVLSAVSRLPELEALYLNGKFAMHALKSTQDPKSLSYPLWRIGNLRSLILSGEPWAKIGNSKHLCALLAKSPNLEYLEVPLEFFHLAECRLPNLKKLKLVMQSGAHTTIDQSRALFLQNHPSIEELNWFPIGFPWIPPTALPNLKSIVTNKRFFMALNSPSYGAGSSAGSTMNLPTPPATPSTPKGPSSPGPDLSAEPLPEVPKIRRQINSLDVFSLDASSLLDLECLDRSCLRKLRLHIFDISTLYEVADAFPNIEWLSLPPTYLPSDSIYAVPVSEDQWLDILPRFKKLRVFRGSGLWSAVNNSEDMHELIRELALRCPNLYELDHCVFSDKLGAFERIVISRNGDEVGYSVAKPRLPCQLDVTNGAFY